MIQWLLMDYEYRLYHEVEVSSRFTHWGPEARGCVNHEETDTEWYNRLVPRATWPWQCIYGLATIASAIKGSSAYLATSQTIEADSLRSNQCPMSMTLAVNVQSWLSFWYSERLLLSCHVERCQLAMSLCHPCRFNCTGPAWLQLLLQTADSAKAERVQLLRPLNNWPAH